MTDHKIGTREEWLTAREELLAREKEHTLLGDRGQLQRRAPAPPGPRRDDDLHLTRPAREAADLSPADGLELQLGLQLRERLQLRLRRLRRRRDGARGHGAARGQRGCCA